MSSVDEQMFVRCQTLTDAWNLIFTSRRDVEHILNLRTATNVLMTSYSHNNWKGRFTGCECVTIELIEGKHVMSYDATHSAKSQQRRLQQPDSLIGSRKRSEIQIDQYSSESI